MRRKIFSKIALFFLTITIVFVATSCAKSEESPQEEKIKSLFSAMYNVEADELESFTDSEGMAQRFAGYFTTDCYDRFAANREWSVVRNIVENGGKTEITNITISSLEADVPSDTYIAEGQVIWSNGSEEKAAPVKAEIRLVEENESWLVESLFFRTLPVF